MNINNKGNNNVRISSRWHCAEIRQKAVHLVRSEGWSCYHVAKFLNIGNPITVKHWVTGLKPVTEKQMKDQAISHSNKMKFHGSKLTSEQWECLLKQLIERQKDGVRCTYNDVIEILKGLLLKHKVNNNCVDACSLFSRSYLVRRCRQHGIHLKRQMKK